MIGSLNNIQNKSYFKFSSGEFSNNFLGVLFVNGASDGKTGTENLLDSAGEGLGHRLFFNDLGDLLDLLEGKVSLVSDVLDFLSISFVVAEFLDDEG